MQNHNSKVKTDLKKRVYLFSLSVISLIDTLDRRDFASEVIAKQVLRSATSIGANIIEAKAASSKKDFARFYQYSLKSANETKFWLGLLRDSDRVSPKTIRPLLLEADELSKILAASLLTMKGKR